MATWTLDVTTGGEDLHEITDHVTRLVAEADVDEGLCTIFVRHTSASLVIFENADPSAREDLRRWFRRLVPEGDPMFRHVAEGPDDMPAHIRSVLTATSLGIPIVNGRLGLGTWQGIFLWEHRRAGRPREVLVHIR